MSLECPTAKREVAHEIEQFLYKEARLLDENKFKEWLDLLTDDIRYWMPVMGRRYRSDSKGTTILNANVYDDREFSNENEVNILDETKDTLTRRVARIDTGMAWAEDPPSSTCHIISNVVVSKSVKEAEVNVFSNFILYRTRGDLEENFYVGHRQDILRLVGQDWKISYRKITLPQNVLSSKNASNFF